MFGQLHDARFELVAAIQLSRHRFVFGARDVAQHVAAPFDPHRPRIVRIVRFANQYQDIADLQLIPQLLAFVKLESCDRRTLDQDARPRLCCCGQAGRA